MGKLAGSRRYGVQIGADCVGGVNSVFRAPSTWARRGVGGVILVFFFKGGLRQVWMWINVFPLGRNVTISSVNHMGFHTT